MAPRAPSRQMDLLAWQPPEPVRKFEEPRVRATSFRERMTRAVAACLHDADDAGRTREEIAGAMSEFLGERVTLNMLNAYASQAREAHSIPVARLVALLHATRDQRLLELLAEPMGWAVVDRKFLPLIELGALREHAAQIERRAKELAHQVARDGVV
nr:DNA transposition protein [uncultured Rhodopila sp.]